MFQSVFRFGLLFVLLIIGLSINLSCLAQNFEPNLENTNHPQNHPVIVQSDTDNPTTDTPINVPANNVPSTNVPPNYEPIVTDTPNTEPPTVYNNPELQPSTEQIPVIEEVIRPVTVKPIGAVEQLNPSLVGLTNMAIKFLPTDYQLVNIITATREIVAGVRFNLLVNANDPVGEPIICEIIVLEKPWLKTEYGDRVRQLQSSNCTESDDWLTTELPNSISIRKPNRFPVDFNFDPNFIPKDKTTKWVTDIDRQVVPINRNLGSNYVPDIQIYQTPDQSIRPNVPIDPSLISIDRQRKIQVPVPGRLETTDAADDFIQKYLNEAKVSPNRNEYLSLPAGIPIPDIDSLNVFAPVITGVRIPFDYQNAHLLYQCPCSKTGNGSPPERQKRSLESIEPHPPVVPQNINTEKEYLMSLAVRALEQMDHIDKDDFKRIPIELEQVQMIDRKPDNDVGKSIYLLTVRIGNSHCLEEAVNLDQCRQSLMDNSLKLCTMEVQVKGDDIQLTKSQCTPEKSRQKRDRLVGAPTEIETSDVERLVQQSLTALKENEDKADYQFSRVLKATRQVVSGYLYQIKVEFKKPPTDKTVICNMEIWDRPWIKVNGRETTIKCDDDGKYDVRHRRSLDLYRDIEPLWVRRKSPGELEMEQQFEEFKKTYNRQYGSVMEHAIRFRIFRGNLFKIDQLNSRELGTATYGITEFADMTTEEYKQRTGMWRRVTEDNNIPHPIADIPDVELPKQFDWREKGVITNVKDQGNCGSCWAFSVTGNIEGLHAIKTGQLEEYSEQELLDCDTIDGACNGGLPDNAYKAIEQIGGLELETEYPYAAKKLKTCSFNKTMSHVQVTGAIDLPKNETKMAQWLITNGPISIGINAGAMQFYRGGISHPWRPLCRHSGIDHGVLLVGFGISEYPLFNKTLPFWIVKNSWGAKWGEQGYYRVYRGDNTCGLNSMASSAVLE